MSCIQVPIASERDNHGTQNLPPNAATPLIVSAVLNLAYNLLGKGGLDCLGFGIAPNITALENRVTAASAVMSALPVLAIAPGLAQPQ
jgi:ABC-type dipeptide/oligopeptide/nickel transport system permease subunit